MAARSGAVDLETGSGAVEMETGVEAGAVAAMARVAETDPVELEMEGVWVVVEGVSERS